MTVAMTSATAIIITAVQHVHGVHVDISLSPEILEIVAGRKPPPFLFQKTAYSKVPPAPIGGREDSSMPHWFMTRPDTDSQNPLPVPHK